MFDHDYEGEPSNSNGLLWIPFFKIVFQLPFEFSGGIRTDINRSCKIYFARSNRYQTVNLTSVQSLKVVQKYVG